MSVTRWPANSYDEARDEVVSMLKTYRLERRNLEQQKRLVQEAIAALGGPGTSNFTATRGQMQHGDDAMVQRIERIATERKSLDRELESIGAQEKRLNNLLRAIGELDTFEKHVVVGQYIDGRSSKELGEMIRKSEDSIALYRKQAVRKLTRILYLIVDNTVGLKEDLR